jgi:hypothetical protein
MVEEFLVTLESSLRNGSFHKLTLGGLRNSLAEARHIYVRMLRLQSGTVLSFTFRFPKKDTISNYSVQESLKLIAGWLGSDCLAATLFCGKERYQLFFDRKGKTRLLVSGAACTSVAGHDRMKPRLFSDERFLQMLGVLGEDGKPKNQQGDKYRQIHHFINIVEKALGKEVGRRPALRVTDMGSGKGYLTFALHVFLLERGIAVQTSGVELRKDLVDQCNEVASRCGYSTLHFEAGNILDTPVPETDLLVALHACDTATDEALVKGVQAGAKWILAAPCCHREIRSRITPPEDLEPLFRFGIEEDRMSEAITDTLRVMYLEACGYAASLQEFVSLEHTQKNLLIVGRRAAASMNRDHLWKRAQQFQELFGVGHQRMADLLRAAGGPFGTM